MSQHSCHVPIDMLENSSDRTSPIDFTYLEELLKATRSRGPAIVNSVIRVFLSNAPLDIAAIRHAMETGDSQAAAHRAHRLISGALNTGAHRLVSQLRVIEQLVIDPRGSTELKLCAGDLATELRQVHDCLLRRYPGAA